MRALAALLLLACSPREAARPPAPGPTEPAVRPAPSASEPAPSPSAPSLPEGREVHVRTADGVELAGTLRAGASPEAPLVVLVHQLSSTRREWEPLCAELAREPALSTFALDMRGHGQSTARHGGDPLAWRNFATADWERVEEDIAAVLAHLREQEHLRPRAIVLIGSSIGSSAVIRAAASDPGVRAIVALSPVRAYRGLDVIVAATQLADRSILVMAAEGETASADTARDLARIVPDAELVLVPGDRHGVAMWAGDADRLARVARFVREHAR